MSPTISVVICAYTMDRWDQILRALVSVQGQTRRPDEVLLVIDYCPELVTWSEEIGPGVRVVVNAEARGLSGARNSGVKASSGDVVAFLDDDAFAEPTWLEKLVQGYEDPWVVGIGGHVVPRWQRRRPAWFPIEFNWVVGCSYAGQPTVTAQVRNPIGANMSFRRVAILGAGGFSSDVGRVGTRPVGCEESELSIRVTRQTPGTKILLEPAAIVHHDVPAARANWRYFRRRCWAEGLSKAHVSRLTDPASALASERSYTLRTLPRGAARGLADTASGRDAAGVARSAAIGAGFVITAAGYATGRVRAHTFARTHDKGVTVNDFGNRTSLNFDFHGLVGLKVDVDAPAAHQLSTMMAGFRTEAEVPNDIVVSEKHELMLDAALLEDDLAYTDDAVQFRRDRVQVVSEGGKFRVSGAGELLTTVLPLLDVLMVSRGAAMIHACTVGYHGKAIALPAAGGTGKTSTVAKLMRRPGFTFMGDDWGFLSEDATLLNYEKPMFIKPHHQPIYPHLFSGSRKPLVPVKLSRPVGRFTSVVHPHIIKYPKLADLARRWSPEHRIVTAKQALPGVEVTASAPLLTAVYVERFEGARTRLVEKDPQWMVERMLGNFHIEMPHFSRELVAGMAATSQLSIGGYFADKERVLSKALLDKPCFVLQVPSVYSPDVASDDIVLFLEELLGSIGPTGEQNAA